MPTTALTDQWGSRDLPVLIAAARKADEQFGTAFMDRELEVEGLDGEDVTRALIALQPTFIEAKVHRTMGPSIPTVVVSGVTDAGRREVGLWPTPEAALDRLLAELRRQSEQAPTEDDRGRARRILGEVGTMSRDMGINLGAAVIAGSAGL